MKISTAVTTRQQLPQQKLWLQNLSRLHLQCTPDYNWISLQVAVSEGQFEHSRQRQSMQFKLSTLQQCLINSQSVCCHCKQHTLLLHILSHSVEKLSHYLSMPQRKQYRPHTATATPSKWKATHSKTCLSFPASQAASSCLRCGMHQICSARAVRIASHQPRWSGIQHLQRSEVEWTLRDKSLSITHG